MAKAETTFGPWERGAHRGVLPVQDDLGDVFHGVQEVIVTPLVPVDGHRAVLIHALENLFCLLFRYLDSQVPQGLHDLLSIDSSCNNRGCELGARPTANPRPGLPLAPEATLTIVLFVQTLEHQPQFLLVILEIMDELFKV